MTDRLSAIIERRDEAELLNYLRGLPKDERVKLAARVKQLAEDEALPQNHYLLRERLARTKSVNHLNNIHSGR